MYMHSGVVWTIGWRGKKHICLQINWFGQEAPKEELLVVKKACGEAGMSQQKLNNTMKWASNAKI